MDVQGKKPDPYEHLSEDARAAMEAVEKAAKGLPPTEDLQMTVFEGDGGFGNKPPDEPPNRGSKVGARHVLTMLMPVGFVELVPLEWLSRHSMAFQRPSKCWL
jgi:hypothetical protein